MNKEPLNNMSEISFRELSGYSITNCIEDKMFLIDDLHQLPAVGRMETTDFIALLFCTEGELNLNMNGKHHTLRQHDILFCNKGAIIYNIMRTPSCKAKILCIAWDYAQKLFLRSTYQWDSILQLRYTPLLHTDTCEQELYRAYYQLLSAKIKCYYYTTDIDCIFQGFFYDFYRMTDRHAIQRSQQKAFHVSLHQEDLFKRFITLLKEKHCSEHFCSFYASQLYVTPKHLTTVVKQVSGKSVSQWIDTYLLDQIVLHLKSTNLTISEIAIKLNFSNMSFFGKYVRKHTGESPTRLRQTLQAE